MPEEESPFDAKEFEEEMQRLAAEAESLSSSSKSPSSESPAEDSEDKPAADSGAAPPPGNGGDRALATALAQMIRPLSVALSSIDQRTKDANKALEDIAQKLESGAGAPAAAPPENEEGSSPARDEDVQKIVDMLAEQKRSENTSQKLFDAMHAEMKGYKDIFLFEALQKPMIQDMLLLYDDLCAIEGQSRHFRRNLKAREEDQGDTVHAETHDFVNDLTQNLENLRSLFMEIFDRLEVEQIKTGKGKVDKQLQKALSIVQTSDPEEDNLVDKKLRPGFRWRDRILRPEEVIVKRYSGD